MPIVVTQSSGISVSELIRQSMKDIGALGSGETPTADELQDGFILLKQMVGQWQAQGLMIYAQSEISFTANGSDSYTIGTGGDVTADRPNSVASAFWRYGNIDYPLEVLNSFDDYQALRFKSEISNPQAVCYAASYPLGQLYVWPAPTNGDIHLTVSAPLPTYSSVTNDLTVPPEYELALRYSLCELLGPSFGLNVRPAIISLAMRSRKIIKRNNVRIPTLNVGNKASGNILTDLN